MPLQYEAGVVLTSVFDTEEEAQAWLDSVRPSELVKLRDSWVEEQLPVANSAEPMFGFATGPVNLINLHSPDICAGRRCCVHDPSDHHMRAWPVNWRADRHMMERVCPHGIAHPDPDDLAYKLSQGIDSGVHGCDGCCRV